MAITAANIAAATGTSTTDATSFSTGSWTPGANKLELLSIAARGTFPITDPTVTGNGLTWVKVVGYDFTDAGRTLYVFRAMGASPSTGAITINFGAQTIQSICWSVDEFSGTDTTGTSGSGAIVQASTAPSGSSDVTVLRNLAAFGSANNAAFGALGRGWQELSTAGTGFTKLADVNIDTAAIALMTEWAINDNTVDASWTTESTFGFHAIEIKAAGEGGTTYTSSPSGAIEVCGNATVAYSRLYASSPTNGLEIGGSRTFSYSSSSTITSSPSGGLEVAGAQSRSYSVGGSGGFNPAIHGGRF